MDKDGGAQVDAALEAEIDIAGREKVFAVMRAHGWTAHDHLPKWMWREAIITARHSREGA